MVNFNYETDFKFYDEERLERWIGEAVYEEGFKLGNVNYIFCDDAYLHKLNVEFLDHDTLTDIISFDYTIGKILQGDIFVSVERVRENANDYGVEFDNELLRVIIHGILHFCGYKDKSDVDAKTMRVKEEYYMAKY